MVTVEDIKDKIRQLLIEKDGNIQSYELKDIIEEARESGISDKQIAKLVPEVDRDINWEYIRAAKLKEAERKEKLLQEIKQKEEQIKSAPEFIDALIQYSLADGVVEAKELEEIFNKASELSQDSTALSRKIKLILDNNKFKPYPNAKLSAPTLKDTLLSTDWYDEKQYVKITTPPPVPPPLPPPFPWKQLITAAVLILVVGSALGYYLWLKPYLRDKNAVRKYTYVDHLTLRSTPVSGVDFNFVQKLDYGTEVLVYDSTIDWSNVKASGKVGYVSNEFLLNKKDFYILNGLFGDEISKSAVVTSKCKKALLDYYNTHNISGKLDATLQVEFYGALQNKEVWQLFAKDKDISPNTVVYPKLTNPNSKFTDFGFLITNINTQKRKFVFYSFTDVGEPVFVHDEDAPDAGYIKSVNRSYNNGQYVYNVKYVN